MSLVDRPEWKAEQILEQLQRGYSIPSLSQVYEVPEEHFGEVCHPMAPEVRRIEAAAQIMS
ncbi:hypothetical protein [Streptomyces albidoflavus]|uniref:hypothetical protein n=1 Tax=Streptomyces TaxID=1883 RepID=UPI0013EEBCD2|nr:hypothetical protein [Streptomyces albidoflavus]